MATAGNDVIFGTGGNDSIDGLAGDDTINTLAGDDTLVGGTGNDALVDGPGHDSVSAGAGRDVLVGAPGNDTLDGGDNIDILSYAGAPGPVTVDLALAGPQQISAVLGFDVLIDVEYLFGSAFNDTLLGDSGFNLFRGGAGNDYIDGRGGPDAAVYEDATSGVTVDLSLSTPQDVGGGRGIDTLLNMEWLAGSTYADNLTGNDEDNHILGDQPTPTGQPGTGGADVILGLGGNDTLIGMAGNDYLDGGTGRDVVRLTGSLSDYAFDFQKHGVLVVTDLRAGSPDGTDTLIHIEALQFGPAVYDQDFQLPSAPVIPIGIVRAYSQLLDKIAAPHASHPHQEALGEVADMFVSMSLSRSWDGLLI